MKRFLLLCILLFTISNVFSQNITEYYFKFIIQDKSELTNLTRIISIDNFKDNEVIAYANQEEFENFKKLGYSYELLQKDIPKSLTMATSVSQMENWDRYPTYEVYRQMMINFQENYPTICKLDSIGTSIQNRQIYVLKISDNVLEDEAEPEFFYTSTMHGDETTGFILMLRLADSLLSSYGSSAELTEMVNNIEIYINPNSNPDGTYRGGNSTVSDATRYNANNKDLNRDYPDPRIGANNPPQEQENQVMMNFAESRHFVMSANFHGGAEVMNYPWDTWTEGYNDYKSHPDAAWFKKICTDYVSSARLINANYMKDVTSSGVTNGGDWYVITGGRQDYMNYWHQCREITVELSSSKLLATESLNYYWEINKVSLLNFIKECTNGIRGTVKNSDGDPLAAMIFIQNHDVTADSTMIFTNPEFGDFYRLIESGTFSIIVSSNGYFTDTIENVTINYGEAVNLDIVLLRESVSSKIEPSQINDTLFHGDVKDYQLIIKNTGILELEYKISPPSDNWIILSKLTGSVEVGGTDTLLATIQTNNMATGNYYSNLTLLENDSTKYYFQVSLNVIKKSKPNFNLITDTLNLGDQKEYDLIIYNQSDIVLDYSLTIDYPVKSDNWITLSKENGSVSGNSNDTVKINLSATALTTGNYSCIIIINESQYVNYTIPVDIYVNQVQSTDEQMLDTKYKIFPNPFDDDLVIEFINDNDKPFHILFYDISGKELFNQTYTLPKNMSSSIKLDDDFNIQKLKSGIYFIRFKTSNSDITRKIIKQ